MKADATIGRSGRAGPIPAIRGHEPSHGATRARDCSGGSVFGRCRRAVLCRAHTAPTPCARHCRVALLVLFALAAAALSVSWHVSTAPGSTVPVELGGAALAGTLAEPLAEGTTGQPEREAVPTARIRYDIPGWDSIRRTSAGMDVSAVEPLSQLPPASIPPENFLVPVVLGLIPPALGWVGLSLTLRCVVQGTDAPPGSPELNPGSHPRGLRKMPATQVRIDYDCGAGEPPSHGGYFWRTHEI